MEIVFYVYFVGMIIAFILGCIQLYQLYRDTPKEKHDEIQIGMLVPYAMFSWFVIYFYLKVWFKNKENN